MIFFCLFEYVPVCGAICFPASVQMPPVYSKWILVLLCCCHSTCLYPGEYPPSDSQISSSSICNSGRCENDNNKNHIVIQPWVCANSNIASLHLMGGLQVGEWIACAWTLGVGQLGGWGLGGLGGWGFGESEGCNQDYVRCIYICMLMYVYDICM